jgi:serine/threonine protein kinase
MKEILISKEVKKNINDSEIIREAKLLKQLKNNPYLIEYEDCFFDETGDFFYIITEFCQVIIIIYIANKQNK